MLQLRKTLAAVYAILPCTPLTGLTAQGFTPSMGSSKNDDQGDGPNLTVVDGHNPGLEPIPDGTDRATMQKLALLKTEHRELDEAIAALIGEGRVDQLQLTRLKKRKLMLRDLITQLEDDMLPDIIA